MQAGERAQLLAAVLEVRPDSRISLAPSLRALILRKCTLSPASECERPPRRASQPSVGHSDLNRFPSVAYQPSAFVAVAALCHFFDETLTDSDGGLLFLLFALEAFSAQVNA